MNNNVAIDNAINTINELIPLVEKAESQFKSARNWSFIDVFGGGTFVDLFKHHKLSKASTTMNAINSLLQRLSYELGNINIPVDYKMNISGFATFADFVFDGAFVDAYMTSKIMSSLNQVKQLKKKLYAVKEQLSRM